LEIQTPHGIIHKVLNLGNDLTVDRTYFEHLAEIRKEDEDTQIKLIVIYDFVICELNCYK